MLIGRNIRKANSQTWAFAFFRWIAIWAIVVWAAQQGKVGSAACAVIIAVDVCVRGLSRAVQLWLSELERPLWHVSLTDRVFYRSLFDAIRDKGAGLVDVDELFKSASSEAAEDMRKSDSDDRIDAGFLDKTGWHVFGGALHFLGLAAAMYAYYGSAVYIGQGGRIP